MNKELYPYKVLFVEDEELLRKNYTSYLQMLFAEVFEAKDGEEALALYKKIKPDILIVDINIPKIDGLELLKIIRQSDIKTKAIILTAYVSKEFLLEATSLKLVRYLEKPVSRKDLKDALLLAVDEILTYNIRNIKTINIKDELLWNNELRELKYQNESIELTNNEKLFLELLLSHPNRVFSYDEIFFHVWNNYDDDASFNAIKNLIRRLRKKLPYEIIQNAFNEGYKINVQ